MSQEPISPAGTNRTNCNGEKLKLEKDIRLRSSMCWYTEYLPRYTPCLFVLIMITSIHRSRRWSLQQQGALNKSAHAGP